MLIHSVTPSFMLVGQGLEASAATNRIQPFSGGYVEGCDTPEGFKLSRVISTDPTVYLNPQYAPGSLFKP